MLCKVFPKFKRRSGAFISVAGAFVFLTGIPTAFADRLVYFEALGHSEITSSGKKLGYYNTATGMGNDTSQSNLNAKCKLTITNSSPNDQNITVNITGTATGTAFDLNGNPVADIATSPTNQPTYSAKDQDGNPASPAINGFGQLINYVLHANNQVNILVTYPAPHYLYQSTQDIRCSGNISIADSLATAPGFVIANGMIITWSQGTSAYQANGSNAQMRAEVRYYYNPFTISGGRAF